MDFSCLCLYEAYSGSLLSYLYTQNLICRAVTTSDEAQGTASSEMMNDVLKIRLFLRPRHQSVSLLQRKGGLIAPSI